MKKIILPVIILAAIGLVSYNVFFKKENVDFVFTEAKIGTIIQEVSETGQVQKGEKITLSFKNAGTIQKIYIKTGEKVKSGDLLARLNTNNLQIQLSEAKAAFDIAQAKLDKLIAGASKEEIQSASTTVANARTALNSAVISLEDIKVQGGINLNNNYENALDYLDDAYLKAYNAGNAADYLQRTYFYKGDQSSTLVVENKNKISTAALEVKSFVDSAKMSKDQAVIDESLSQVKSLLAVIADSLKIVREACEDPNYSGVVSSTDKTSLDGHRAYIATASANITASQQAIASMKLTNISNINTYTAAVLAAEGSLKAAEDQFAILISDPRKEDVDLYSAQVSQVENQVKFLESQIADSSLKSPINGTIAEVFKREGEIVQPSAADPAFSIIPDSAYQIKVDVYEEDVVKMSVGNEVEISLVAFPNIIFQGELIEISPSEKLKDGVIYYEATIDFKEEVPDTVKIGMTADLIVKTAIRENVLTLSVDAIQKKNGGYIVKVFDGQNTVEKDIETGLKGRDGMMEIISGLSDGEQVILK